MAAMAATTTPAPEIPVTAAPTAPTATGAAASAVAETAVPAVAARTAPAPGAAAVVRRAALAEVGELAQGVQVHEALAAEGINAPASHFYALEASRHAGLGDDGAVRAGLAPYTSAGDVSRLLTAVAALAAAG